MVQPDVEIDDGTGRIIISSEEGETEGNKKILKKLFLQFCLLILFLFKKKKTMISLSHILDLVTSQV